MRPAHAMLFAIGISLSSLATASNVDPVYYPDQGKVVLPNLKMGNQVYYVVLTQLPNSYDFRLDMTSVNNLSTPLTFTPATAADLVGTFSPQDDAASSVTFKADGTYSMIEGSSSDPTCRGPESGTWQYEPATAVLTVVAVNDGNGICGFSTQTGIVRVKASGTNLTFMKVKNGVPKESLLIRK